MIAHPLKFKKEERLKSRLLIQELFLKGLVIKEFPIKLYWIEAKLESKFPFQAGFSVPKNLFRKSVDRNYLKRRMREAYRLQKINYYNKIETNSRQFALMFVYSGKEKSSLKVIAEKINIILLRFINEIT